MDMLVPPESVAKSKRCDLIAVPGRIVESYAVAEEWRVFGVINDLSDATLILSGSPTPAWNGQ
jgi:hypothetical protein